MLVIFVPWVPLGRHVVCLQVHILQNALEWIGLHHIPEQNKKMKMVPLLEERSEAQKHPVKQQGFGPDQVPCAFRRDGCCSAVNLTQVFGLPCGSGINLGGLWRAAGVCGVEGRHSSFRKAFLRFSDGRCYLGF